MVNDLKKDKCKTIVHVGFKGLIEYQCTRNIYKDGFCWQHRPSEVKKRQWRAAKRLEVTPFYMIHRY